MDYDPSLDSGQLDMKKHSQEILEVKKKRIILIISFYPLDSKSDGFFDTFEL